VNTGADTVRTATGYPLKHSWARPTIVPGTATEHRS
jgi:hypothetical protein